MLDAVLPVVTDEEDVDVAIYLDLGTYVHQGCSFLVYKNSEISTYNFV